LPSGVVIDRQPVGGGSGFSFRTNPDSLQNGLTFMLTAVLFARARRRNGWTALHDRVTASRVVATGAAAVRRTSSRTETDATTPIFKKRRRGPFTVTSELGATPDGHLFAAFDPILRRPVWIHDLSSESPPVAPARRDVNRIGRLHWLAGRRSADENWD